jgi:hypothetical protein
MVPAKFMEALGGKLGERWAAAILTPAFLFWGGGLLAFMDRNEWARLRSELSGLSEPLQIAVMGAALLLVAVSAFAAQRFEFPILRILEGYWPAWTNAARRGLIHQKKKQLTAIEARLNHLRAHEEMRALTPDEAEQMAHLEWKRRFMPSQADQLMPTRLGNTLRAGERRPQEKYGLDAVVCWPHLWLLLPDNVRLEVENARANLNALARLCLWGVLFLIWTPHSWWALPIGLLVAAFSYAWMLEAAEGMSTLVEAAYDLHRMDLYRAMNWHLPINSDEEQKLGQLLTEYLWRGPVRGPVAFALREKQD